MKRAMTDESSLSSPYDPTWLVELAVTNFPAETWLHDALRQCTTCVEDLGDFVTFVDRMQGKFQQNIVLFSPEKGKVVLDLLEDGRIGGFEVISISLLLPDEVEFLPETDFDLDPKE